MRTVPSDNVFSAHGLYHVKLDVPAIRSAAPVTITIPAADTFATAEWIAGTAELRPVDRFPLLRPTAKIPSTVRFSFCPSSDQHSMARFRRQAQLLALGTIPTAPGPSNRYGRVREVIAWWEDEHGLWFVVDEEPEEGINLVEAWSKIMQDPDMEDLADAKEGLPTNTERRSKMSSDQALKVYAEICELLVKVIKAIKVSHFTSRNSVLTKRHYTKETCRSSHVDL